MHYINPFELLNLDADDLSIISASVINKAKRKLLTEIELSDNNTISHKGIDLTRSNCIKAIDDLDDKDKREFHYFILQNKYLLRFLSERKIDFFENYKAESIYKLSDFLDFISPVFSEQYDKLLSQNFKSGNIEYVKKVLSVKPITNEIFFEKCYKDTYALLRNINNEIGKINAEISANNSSFIDNNFAELEQTISNKVNIDLINTLPLYFKSVRNQLAQTINELSTTINNAPYKSYETAFKIIKLAKSISIDGLTSQRITRDFYIVRENYESEVKKKEEEAKLLTYSKEIDHYNNILDRIEIIIDELENKTSTYNAWNFPKHLKWIQKHINVSELNSLPKFSVNIQKKIAVQLMSLSITVWNKYQEINPALEMIRLALTINVDDETKARIEENYEIFKNNEEHIKENGKPIKSVPSLSSGDGIGQIIYDDTLYFGIGNFPIFPIARYSLEYDGLDTYTFFGRLKLHWWQKTWNLSIIFAILFLTTYLIVDNISTRNLYNSFKIVKNGYTGNYQANRIVNSPYLRKKVLPINMIEKEIDEIYKDLSDAIRATSSSEVMSIVQVWRGSNVVGKYTDNKKAIQRYIFYKIIDLETNTQIYQDTIFGTLPPERKRGKYDGYGSNPQKYFVHFLSKIRWE